MSQAVWTTETILGCHKHLVTRGFQLEAQRMSQNGESTFVFFNSPKPDSLRKPQDRELNVSGLVLVHVWALCDLGYIMASEHPFLCV